MFLLNKHIVPKIKHYPQAWTFFPSNNILENPSKEADHVQNHKTLLTVFKAMNRLRLSFKKEIFELRLRVLKRNKISQILSFSIRNYK